MLVLQSCTQFAVLLTPLAGNLLVLFARCCGTNAGDMVGTYSGILDFRVSGSMVLSVASASTWPALPYYLTVARQDMQKYEQQT